MPYMNVLIKEVREGYLVIDHERAGVPESMSRAIPPRPTNAYKPGQVVRVERGWKMADPHA